MNAPSATHPRPPLPDQPLVSIIVPAYNHEAFVEHTLQSIEDQTYPNVEIVVVNDGSKDRTGERAQAFLAKSRHRTIYLEHSNRGINKTIDAGFKASHGDLVAFLASDDWIVPDKTRSQVEDLLAHDCDAVYGNIVNVYLDGQQKAYKDAREFLDHWDAEEFIERLVTAHGPMLQSGLFRRSILEAIGGVDHGIGQEDWPIHILVARAARRIRVHKEPVVFYRMHDTNIVRTKQVQLLRWKLEIVKRYTRGRTLRHAKSSAHGVLAGSIVRQRPFYAAWHMAVSLAYKPRGNTIGIFWRRFRRSVGDRVYGAIKGRKAA